MLRRALITFVVLSFPAFAGAGEAAPEVSFNRDIRPILSDTCFKCHGPAVQKAKFRLDSRDEAMKPAESGAVPLVPNQPAESEIVKRLFATDESLVMPPPSSNKTLMPAQRELIRRWIEQGAKYQKHWSLEAPTQPPVPLVDATVRVINPIDSFIVHRLKRDALKSSVEADNSTLIRRVAFALTGLPPTVKEVAEFQTDSSPQAYEKMVDRYLASERYGEEMARHWLDVARYADTHGLHLDNERTMWAYRDWVIQSFNRNQPFDKFTVEQLAGDLLPNPTTDQLVATGFNRCNVTTSEGGSIEAEFVYRYAVDRTATMIQTWMGLTGGCAVCHDHKYDPLTTREFYSLYSFFHSAADPAMDKNTNATDPFFKLTNESQKAALAQLQAAETAAKQQLEAAASRAEYHDPADIQPAPGQRTIDDVWLDDVFPFGSKATCSSRNASVWVTSSELDLPLGRRALKQLSASNYQDKFEGYLQPFVVPEQPKLSVWVRVDEYSPSKTLRLELGTSRGDRRFLWGDTQNYPGQKTDKNRLGEIPEPNRWTQLEVSSKNLDLQPGDTVRSVALAQFGGIAWWDNLKISGEVHPATDVRSSFSAWWKERAGKETPGVPSDLAAFLKAGPKTATENAAEQNKSSEQADKLRHFFLAYIHRPGDGELQQQQRAWIDAQSARAAFEDAIPGTFIFKDLEQPRESFVMLRGQYDKPGEKVEPSVPAVFSPLPQREGRPTRLDLANWLLSPEHPLTARVTVNRFWQQFFGTGLVKTSDDFGSQGEPPSHPELLDWLATWYREHGWDTKALVKLLVMSSTFRQATRVTPELLSRDPENRLYARGPRFRLDAEQVRDNALFVGGLMNLEQGGRGVKSYQPPNIWEPVGYSDSNTRFYLQDHGSALYRRSIYAFLKRTAPPPFMSNFDAPNREQFCARRERSNTPLQALQLLNDTQHFEAARSFGERILAEGGATPDSRITFAYRATLSRAPNAEELATVKQAFEYYRSRFQKDAESAKRVVTVGESKRKSPADDSELATYTLIANLILNLDETVTRN